MIIAPEIDRVEQVNRRMNNNYIRDYANLPALSSYFMSMPLPAWIKTINTRGSKPIFKSVQTNYSFFDAYGIKPEEEFIPEDHWMKGNLDQGYEDECRVLSTMKPHMSETSLYNGHLKRDEMLRIYRWPVTYGKTIALCGAVIDPTYIDELLLRVKLSEEGNDDEDLNALGLDALLDRMEQSSNKISMAKRNLIGNTELVQQFFDKSPIPMWVKQYIGRQNSPRTAHYHIAQHSRGFTSFKKYNEGKKLLNLEDNRNDMQAAISRSVVENGSDVFSPKRLMRELDEGKELSMALRQLNWPIIANGELTMVAGVILGYK